MKVSCDWKQLFNCIIKVTPGCIKWSITEIPVPYTHTPLKTVNRSGPQVWDTLKTLGVKESSRRKDGHQTPHRISRHMRRDVGPLKLQPVQLPNLALGAAEIRRGDIRETRVVGQGGRILRWERRTCQRRKQASDLPQNVSSPQTLRKDSSASTSSQPHRRQNQQLSGLAWSSTRGVRAYNVVPV